MVLSATGICYHPFCSDLFVFVITRGNYGVFCIAFHFVLHCIGSRLCAPPHSLHVMILERDCLSSSACYDFYLIIQFYREERNVIGAMYFKKF